MQRSKVRRQQAIKGSQGRVASLNDAAQFQKLSKKYSDRLILLLTYTVLLSGLVLANQAMWRACSSDLPQASRSTLKATRAADGYITYRERRSTAALTRHE